jgi:hypothetical protein
MHQLPYPIWFPFNTEYGGYGFWCASVILIGNSFLVVSICCTLNILPIIFMSFAIGLIKELQVRIKDIEKCNKNIYHGPKNLKTRKKLQKLSLEKLVQCVEMHKKIRKLVEDIQDNFAIVFFSQGLMCVLILCKIAFVMSTVSIFKR